ncbi:hypothetical protein ACH5RR_033691 [Cinchona calisaya]|uniref:Uncharacterized protein n=1 Tax=Cinchona calisaya TaxID=153742 RepID=A0ABD2YCA5_9GENT
MTCITGCLKPKMIFPSSYFFLFSFFPGFSASFLFSKSTPPLTRLSQGPQFCLLPKFSPMSTHTTTCSPQLPDPPNLPLPNFPSTPLSRVYTTSPHVCSSATTPIHYPNSLIFTWLTFDIILVIKLIKALLYRSFSLYFIRPAFSEHNPFSQKGLK